jgi:hypothetical protein
MDTPSPAEAREALTRVRRVRLETTDSLHPSWRMWVAVGAVISVFHVAYDFGPAGQAAAVIGFGALSVAWAIAARRSPRLATAAGVLHHSALPVYAWLPMVLVCLMFGTAQFFAGPAVHRLLTGSGMPAWIRDHPYATVALPYAALCVAVGLLTNVAVRRMARHGTAR